MDIHGYSPSNDFKESMIYGSIGWLWLWNLSFAGILGMNIHKSKLFWSILGFTTVPVQTPQSTSWGSTEHQLGFTRVPRQFLDPSNGQWTPFWTMILLAGENHLKDWWKVCSCPIASFEILKKRWQQEGFGRHTHTHAFMAGLAKDYHILPILATHLSTERSWIQIPRPKRLWGRESSNPAVSQSATQIPWDSLILFFDMGMSENGVYPQL